MNEHRTEQQLIDYAFQLASEAAMQETRAHLEACQACGQKLDALRAKFATLDLLRDEIPASDDLIAQTVAAATAPEATRIIPIWRHTWLGAAAAVIVVGAALLVTSTFQTRPAPTETATRGRAYEKAVAKEEREMRPTTESMGLSTSGRRIAADSAASKPSPIASESFPAPAAAPGKPLTMMAAAQKLDEAIDEKPPFAPASAIELVVLPRRENVQLTIYNSADLTLVRERRNLTLKRGWNWLQFMWAQTLIDPTSLTLEPLEHKDQVEVRQLVFPPRLRELGRWLIRSEVSGQVPFELTYLTSGLAWRAFYMGTLSADETTMDLEAYVRVDNHSGEDYEDAQTRLIVGQVHLLDQIRDLAQRQYAYGSPLPVEGWRGGVAGERAAEDRGELRRELAFIQDRLDSLAVGQELREIRKEGLSEYFLYTIKGTETIPNTWGKRLLSFEAHDIPVTSLYKYDEQRWGTQPIRFVSFANDTEHELGETPLPNGAVRIYGRADAEGRLSYTGGTEVKYIPVGEEVELNLGPARLVKVAPILMELRTENYVFDDDRDITGWDEARTWKVEVTNARTLPVEIEVTRGFDTPQWELTLAGDGVAYEKHDVTHARFKLTVAPRSEEVFTYTVTTYHGVREEVFIKRQQEQQ
ncbi:MAG: hypothetical protein JSW27_03525 [Phycisphaerales bacterium]|nr:MAG: hypothetical protein JSW27_03525 [Phycisphaerales bacterium]